MAPHSPARSRHFVQRDEMMRLENHPVKTFWAGNFYQKVQILDFSTSGEDEAAFQEEKILFWCSPSTAQEGEGETVPRGWGGRRPLPRGSAGEGRGGVFSF